MLVLLALNVPTRAAPVARQATPVASPVASIYLLDLAAMALTGDDLPPGYTADFERYLTAEQIPAYGAPGISPDEVAATGVRRFYDSFYLDSFCLATDGQSLHRSYVEEYGSPAEAEAGFALFEDEERLPPEFAPSSHEELPGPGVGEEPSEITYETFTFGSDPPEGRYVDATFRVGSILAGVSLDGPYPGDLDATPGARPKPDPAAVALVTDLAAVLDDRIEAVQAGHSPAGTNLDLPGRLLPPDPAWLGLEAAGSSEWVALARSGTTRPSASATSGAPPSVSQGPGAAGYRLISSRVCRISSMVW